MTEDPVCCLFTMSYCQNDAGFCLLLICYELLQNDTGFCCLFAMNHFRMTHDFAANLLEILQNETGLFATYLLLQTDVEPRLLLYRKKSH